MRRRLAVSEPMGCASPLRREPPSFQASILRRREEFAEIRLFENLRSEIELGPFLLGQTGKIFWPRHDVGGEENQQLRLRVVLFLALEGIAEDRDVAEDRHLG